MQLTAVFESWHIGDGNYPPLHRGQRVRLSFELEASNLAVAPTAAGPRLEHLGNAKYRGVGRALRVYRGEESITVIEADGFRFYVNRSVTEKLNAGASVEFAGTLLLDHYLWVEFLPRYSDAPDLFYNLRVTRILRVSVPERFVTRHSRGKALPTRVGCEAFEDVEDIETMEGQRFDEEFYVVDFDTTGLEHADIPRTFQ